MAARSQPPGATRCTAAILMRYCVPTAVTDVTSLQQPAPPVYGRLAARSWHHARNALDHVEILAEPPDLAAALDAAPGARHYWDAFPRSTRRAILEWITNARTGPTRQARIQRTADDAARNIRANQWRQPKDHASDSTRQAPGERD